MAAKKRGKKHTDKGLQDTFKTNPFKDMKGFCVDSREKSPAYASTSPVKKDAPEDPSARNSNDDVDFAAAMGGMGVEPLGYRDGDVARDDSEEQSPSAGEESSSRSGSFNADELSEEELFLHHLGQMDAVFNDSYPDPDQSAQEQASARRMRQLRKGRLRPEATLDLHGCYREEARKKARNFLESRQRQGMKTVLIITGRGLRSKNGESVIRSDIEAYLRTRAKAWVVEWGRAPKQYGGDGALVVFLR
jgi:DNA-nicking Smr family endonuclease